MQPEQKWGCISREGGGSKDIEGKKLGLQKIGGCADKNIEGALTAVFTRLLHAGSPRPVKVMWDELKIKPWQIIVSKMVSKGRD